MTKPSRQLHWDSYCESEPVSICASAVSVLSVCLYLSVGGWGGGVDTFFQSPEHPQPRLLPSRPSSLVSQCFLDWFGLCSLYLFAFACAPFLSYCWHAVWSVGRRWKLWDCQSSKQPFTGLKNSIKSLQIPNLIDDATHGTLPSLFVWSSTAFTFVSCLKKGFNQLCQPVDFIMLWSDTSLAEVV